MLFLITIRFAWAHLCVNFVCTTNRNMENRSFVVVVVNRRKQTVYLQVIIDLKLNAFINYSWIIMENFINSIIKLPNMI